jgi:predicted  nucleic acid-binding Zn-ribbon protein
LRQALQTLIELAQIDEELLVLELSRGDLPKRVEQLKTELQRQQEKSDALHASVETSQQQNAFKKASWPS